MSTAPGRRGTSWDLLAVGLGNPGDQYRGTRHNVGAEAVQVLADRFGERFTSAKESALVAELRPGGPGAEPPVRVAVAFPQTFMNESGRAVRPLCRRYGIEEMDRLVVIHDELDLDVGDVRVKRGGGLAGNNGLRSIRDHLGTTDFIRVRIGIGRPPGGSQRGAAHVLSRPSRGERVELDISVERAADAVQSIWENGVERTMETVNRRS